MVTAIINEIKKKYHQCETTFPFLKFPLLQDFVPNGTTKNIEKVLKGEYKCPPGTDDFTRYFIQVYKAKEIKAKLLRTPSQFKSIWKVMKKFTGTHDIHFGHFIASLKVVNISTIC